MRIVYCHFLASCTSRFVFALGVKSNSAQKKRWTAELFGSASVQTVYIFPTIFLYFPTFFVLFYPFSTFSPLIFCLIPLFNISLSYPFVIFHSFYILKPCYNLYSFSLSSLYSPLYFLYSLPLFLLSLLYLLLFLFMCSRCSDYSSDVSISL